MGLVAVVSTASEGVSTAAARTFPTGLAAGGIFVAVLLVLLLAYVDLLDASRIEDEQLRRLLVASVLPLGITFVVVVLYESATLL